MVLTTVTPAEAGAQFRKAKCLSPWTPAFAGVTVEKFAPILFTLNRTLRPYAGPRSPRHRAM